jgi:hypothetical protein
MTKLEDLLANSMKAPVDTHGDDDAEVSRSRDADSREMSLRPETYKPPNALPHVPDTPDWCYRWVRVSSLGVEDPENFMRRAQDGFKPVPAAEAPEVVKELGELRMSLAANVSKDLVIISGLVLCRAPRHLMKLRQDHYEKANREALASTQGDLRRSGQATGTRTFDQIESRQSPFN